MDNYELTLLLEMIFASGVYALSETLSNIFTRLKQVYTSKANDYL
jgi:hypothetical protein